MIGDNLKKIRKKKKIGLNELSRMSGVNASYISAIERGEKTNPSNEILEKLTGALDVSSIALLLGVDLPFYDCGFGEYANRIRKKKDITLEDLSAKTELPVELLELIENGNFSVNSGHVKLLSIALEEPYEYLLSRAGIIELPISEADSSKSDFKISETNSIYKSDSFLIPTQFINPDDARAYISKHEIFASDGFDLKRKSDEEVLDIANEMLNYANYLKDKHNK